MITPSTTDDFGQPIWRAVGERLYFGATVHGAMALMTHASWLHHRYSVEVGRFCSCWIYNGEVYERELS